MIWKDGKMFILIGKMFHFFNLCVQFISGKMRINRKNEKFYRNYALERWKDVSFFLFMCIVYQWKNENQQEK